MKRRSIYRVLAAVLLLGAVLLLWACEEKEEFTFEINESGGAVLTGYHGKGGDVVVPYTYDGIPVVGVDSFAFVYKQSVTSVTLPETVEYIGQYAFVGSSELRTVTLTSDKISIGEGAFSNCRGLEEITLNGCESIPKWAFKNCSSLVNIDVSGITEIGYGAFSAQKALVLFPDRDRSRQRKGRQYTARVCHEVLNYFPLS